MAQHVCEVCGYIHDEERHEERWEELPPGWECPVCGTGKNGYHLVQSEDAGAAGTGAAAGTVVPGAGVDANLAGDQGDQYLGEWRRFADEFETNMAAIHSMAETGASLIEPMRTRKPVISWDDILVKGAQLARFPLDKDAAVKLQTVLGPAARQPLVLETPVYITHMSFGALSREVKIALARGSAAVKTAMCSGEGGILGESMEAAYRYIFEYVPNKYSVNDENLRRCDALEIKFGQSVKPGMGGHLPGAKVTEQIAEVRGFPQGEDIISPSRFPEIKNRGDLRKLVGELRERSDGRPIGIKVAAGHIEKDLEFALFAEPDFITIDGRPGATGAAPKVVKDATSVPTIYALHRARKVLDAAGAKDVSLVITGGLRISSDFIKALAMGADAVAIGTAALMACCCQQYRVCNTGQCPVGCTTQDPQLRARLNIDTSAKRVENFLRVCTEELRDFCRLTGHGNVHEFSVDDLCTTNSEISGHTDIEHV
jgi:glutamate synthase domain-containing protein 2/rubredoxin